MSAPCPNGHLSETSDYCSVCGTPLAAPTTTPATAPTTVSRVEQCPNCGAPLGLATSACAECGHVLSAPVAEAPWVEQNWEVVVRPDRDYYEMLEPEGMEFPETTSSRRVPLIGDLVAIGRRSKSKAIEPEIDLSGSLEDTGVSHRHAVLMRRPEGTWALVDQGSTNGTYLNAEQEPVPRTTPFRCPTATRFMSAPGPPWPWSVSTQPRPVTPTSTVVRRRTPGTWPDRTGAPRSTCSVHSGSGCRERRSRSARRRSEPSWRCWPCAWDLRFPLSISSSRSGARRRPRPPSRRCRATSWSSGRCCRTTPLRRRRRWATASASRRTPSTPAGSNDAAARARPFWPWVIRAQPWPSWSAGWNYGAVSPCRT